MMISLYASEIRERKGIFKCSEELFSQLFPDMLKFFEKLDYERTRKQYTRSRSRSKSTRKSMKSTGTAFSRKTKKRIKG